MGIPPRINTTASRTPSGGAATAMITTRIVATTTTAPMAKPRRMPARSASSPRPATQPAVTGRLRRPEIAVALNTQLATIVRTPVPRPPKNAAAR